LIDLVFDVAKLRICNNPKVIKVT